jgi:chromosome transmission fidelity protein 1
LGFVNHTNLTGKAEDAANTEKVESDQSKAFMSRHISALSIVETFLERLTCTSKEGKVIVEWPNGDVPSNGGSNQALFRFVQIHSASLLDTMVEEAHAIILAGGTLR